MRFFVIIQVFIQRSLLNLYLQIFFLLLFRLLHHLKLKVLLNQLMAIEISCFQLKLKLSQMETDLDPFTF